MTDSEPGLLAELQKRKVIRVGIAYLVIAWLIAQVAELALDSFEAPGWVIKAILVTLALGLPLSLFFAWIFELTPEGLKREKVAREQGTESVVTGRQLNVITIAGLSLALIYFVANHDWGDAASGPVADRPKSIAVLPFDNMSGNQENAFFASGMQEDILTNLAKVSDLRVISRSSVKQYAGGDRDIRAIARELGVDHIVEGSVRRAGNTVRVTAQLIDARSDQHIWAENYDRDLANVFEIQSSIAREIVTALQARLSPDEAQAIDRAPTNSIEAYDLYVQAREIRAGAVYGPQQFARMEPLLQRAVEIDPGFALAHAMLGAVYTSLYWTEIDKSDARLKSALEQINRAFELEPDLPEAHAALAEYYYRGFKNYPRALQQLKIAYEKYPNNPEVIHMLAATQRRLGQWQDAIESFRAYTQLDPGDFREKALLLETMVMAHRFDTAIEYAEALRVSYPQEPVINLFQANAYILGSGDTEAAASAIRNVPPAAVIEYFASHVFLLVTLRQYDKALQTIDMLPDEFLQVLPGAGDALKSLIHFARGERETSRQLAAQGIAAMQPMLSNIEPADFLVPFLISAQLHVVTDDLDTARELALRIVDAATASTDAVEHPNALFTAAWVLVSAGETGRGYDTLQGIINKPGGPTSWQLRLDPVWDPYRDDPRFESIVGLE